MTFLFDHTSVSQIKTQDILLPSDLLHVSFKSKKKGKENGDKILHQISRHNDMNPYLKENFFFSYKILKSISTRLEKYFGC